MLRPFQAWHVALRQRASAVCEAGTVSVLILCQHLCTGYLKDECGLPLGWLVCPFAKVSQAGAADIGSLQSDKIARCRQCYA